MCACAVKAVGSVLAFNAVAVGAVVLGTVAVSVVDPYSRASWIRNTDPDPNMQIYDKMEVKDFRFRILNNHSET